jgi:hypothetical protein
LKLFQPFRSDVDLKDWNIFIPDPKAPRASRGEHVLNLSGKPKSLFPRGSIVCQKLSLGIAIGLTIRQIEEIAGHVQRPDSNRLI